MLYQLVYRSRIARQVRFEDAQQIAQAASGRNEQLGISGMLIYTPSYFLQVLEGEREVVRATYERIGRDPRHEQVTVLLEGELAERRFGDWGMRATLPSKELSAQNIQQMDGGAVVQLLLALR